MLPNKDSMCQQDAGQLEPARRGWTHASSQMHGRQPPESGIEHRKLKGIYGSLDVIVIAGRAVVFPAVDILRAQGGGWPHFDFAAGFMRHRLYSSKAGCGVGRRHHRLGEEETNPLVFLRRCRPNASPPHAVQGSQTLRRVAFQHTLQPPTLCELLTGAGDRWSWDTGLEAHNHPGVGREERRAGGKRMPRKNVSASPATCVTPSRVANDMRAGARAGRHMSPIPLLVSCCPPGARRRACQSRPVADWATSAGCTHRPGDPGTSRRSSRRPNVTPTPTRKPAKPRPSAVHNASGALESAAAPAGKSPRASKATAAKVEKVDATPTVSTKADAKSTGKRGRGNEWSHDNKKAKVKQRLAKEEEDIVERLRALASMNSLQTTYWPSHTPATRALPLPSFSSPLGFNSELRRCGVRSVVLT